MQYATSLAKSQNVKRLQDYDGKRANNLTLIRLLLALLVIFGHSWPLTGTPGTDPLTATLDEAMWRGRVAVDGFFAISGFLVAGSFERQGIVGFAVARVLRIYPGLFVCIGLSVFGLGLLETTLPASDYLLSPQTHRYLLNATLIPQFEWSLPGVFADHPYKALNGSLWSLKPEVTCYLVLALLGLAGIFKSKSAVLTVCMTLLVAGSLAFKKFPIIGAHPDWALPMGYFILGVLAWTYRGVILLQPRFALAAAAGFIAINCIPVASGVYHPVFAICFFYLILYAAFAMPHVDADKLPGDLSYGLYIYAFPCQQIVYWNGQGPYTNALIATALTGALAAMSWYLVERPALSLKKAVAVQKARLAASPRL